MFQTAITSISCVASSLVVQSVGNKYGSSLFKSRNYIKLKQAMLFKGRLFVNDAICNFMQS